MKGTDLDNVSVGSADRYRIEEHFQILNLREKSNKWIQIRLFGPVFSKAVFWVQSKKGGKSFCVPCRCYNPETQEIEADVYDPWYDEYQRENDINLDRAKRPVRLQKTFYMQAIVRSEQEKAPTKNSLTSEERESGIKDVESDSWTPVYVVPIPTSLLKSIQDLKEDNIVKTKSGTRKSYNVAHEKYGRDIMIRYTDKAGTAPGDMYKAKLVIDEGKTPLTEEEKEYLTWDMDALYEPKASEAEAKKEFSSWAKRYGLDLSEAEEDEDYEDEEVPSLKKKRNDVKKKRQVEDDEDAFEDDTDDEDEDEDDEPAPRKKSKKVVEDDDEDDFEDDDEDEEEPPRKKSKKSKVEDDEDEDDFEDDEDEEEDDEPPRKSKKSASKKKKVVDEEDEDDFEDDDEDDEPSPRKKSKKVVEDEEDDEPPRKSKKTTKKKRSVEDDEDFENDEDDWE